MQVGVEQVLRRLPASRLGYRFDPDAFVVERGSEPVAATVERERFDAGRFRGARPGVSKCGVGDTKGILVTTEIGEGDEKVRW